MAKLLASLVLTSILLGIASAATNKVVCYYGSWAKYRNGNGHFTASDIDANLCTHAIYTFVGINADGTVRILDKGLEIDSGNFKTFTGLKTINPNLKTLVAIGGWNQGSALYSSVAASPTKRATLIKSALDLVKTYGFDGFDVDWEYPAQRGGAAVDKANYITLLKEFREVWDKNGLILTAAVAATGGSVDLSYDVPAMTKYLDIINVMAYDLHGVWEGVTGQNAPLYASSVDKSASQKQLNVDASIRGWISRGADPQKLALGLGVYGRTYTLSSSSNNKLGSPVINSGNAGKYTLEPGMLGYHEICELQKEGGWTVVWDDEQKVPYMTKGNQWVGYDDPKSIAIKTNYAKSLNLAGVMIWSIENEDFRGNCGEKYPILNAIRTALGTSNQNSGGSGNDNSGGNSGNNPVTKATTTTTTKKPAAANPTEICTKVGYVRDPVDCNVFYYCLLVGNSYAPLKQQCNAGLYFDEAKITCDWPQNVKC